MTDDTPIAELVGLICPDGKPWVFGAEDIARRIHAAGWRRPGPITDAQVEAGARLVAREIGGGCIRYGVVNMCASLGIQNCSCRRAARAVLEAAASRGWLAPCTMTVEITGVGGGPGGSLSAPSKVVLEAAAVPAVPDVSAIERERCAKIAENPGFIQAQDTEWDEGVNFAKRFIAAAIRAQLNSKESQ